MKQSFTGPKKPRTVSTKDQEALLSKLDVSLRLFPGHFYHKSTILEGEINSSILKCSQHFKLVLFGTLSEGGNQLLSI